MYSNIIPMEGMSPGHSYSLPRHPARSRSPGRPQLALVICPEYNSDYCSSPGGGGSPVLSPRPTSPVFTQRFPYPASPRQALVHHSLARARGDYVLRDTSSLPCSPLLQRPGFQGSQLSLQAREFSLPGSPSLPRMRIQDYTTIEVSEHPCWFYLYVDIHM